MLPTALFSTLIATAAVSVLPLKLVAVTVKLCIEAASKFNFDASATVIFPLNGSIAKAPLLPPVIA